MVVCSNCYINAALSIFALGCVGLNSTVNNKEVVITSFVVFILTEIAFLIKTVQCFFVIQNYFFSLENICLLLNISFSACISLSSVVGCAISGSFRVFYLFLYVVALSVVFSSFLLCKTVSYVIYDLNTSIQTLMDRFVSRPSMNFDIAVVELKNGGVGRVYLPMYSKVDQKCPEYSLYDGDPPVYGDVLFNDGDSLEGETLLKDGIEVVFSGSCPNYRAIQNHRVVERSEVGEVSVNMETNV